MTRRRIQDNIREINSMFGRNTGFRSKKDKAFWFVIGCGIIAIPVIAVIAAGYYAVTLLLG